MIVCLKDKNYEMIAAHKVKKLCMREHHGTSYNLEVHSTFKEIEFFFSKLTISLKLSNVEFLYSLKKNSATAI